MMLTALLLAAAPVAADLCRDDRGTDRCEPAAQARMRALYGLKPIEEHARAGDEVRRVFYVDGYGRDQVAITFARAPGRDPEVSVHFPKREGERSSEPLRALVPQPVWQDLARRSRLFDRGMAPLPNAGAEICLHSSVYVVEASEPARSNNQRAALRSKTEDACVRGPVAAFADEVQRAALPLFPYCDRLDPARHRGPASQLSACRLLSGDRMAAAEAFSAVEAAELARGGGERLSGLFADEAVIEWGAERRKPGGGAAEYWASKVAGAGRSNFYFERVQGLAADRAKVTGGLARSEAGANGFADRYLRAPVELILTFGPAQQWAISEAKVGPWQTEGGQ